MILKQTERKSLESRIELQQSIYIYIYGIICYAGHLGKENKEIGLSEVKLK